MAPVCPLQSTIRAEECPGYILNPQCFLLKDWLSADMLVLLRHAI